MPMHKNVICLFSFSFIIQNVCMCRVRESERWLKYTHRRTTVQFSLPFCFILPGLKSSLANIISQTTMKSLWSHLLPTHYLWTCLLSNKLLTQLTWYFHWENNCILFTLGNKHISCYTTHTIYVVCQRYLPVDIQHMILKPLGIK